MSTPPSIADLRQDYTLASLLEKDAPADPLAFFSQWFEDARRADIIEPNAMTLATLSADQQLTTRTVLLKGLDATGFVFYTNYESTKASAIEQHPQVAVTFLWKEIQRQVNLTGRVERVSREESDAYFHTRPYRSQLGAHTSCQSQVIPDRAWLEERFAELEARFPEGQVPLPENWGGYRIIPQSLEFWQGRRSRLHDRLRYRRAASAEPWIIERLSP
jgi:pyridoxamine 5'-phosphate oxidase